jgi:uncharacterized protein (TIGR03437 family)
LAVLCAGASYGQVIIVNAAFEARRPLSPNSLAVAFGDFTGATPAIANSLPIPKLLGGVEVIMEGKAASIYSVSRTQINFVVPADVLVEEYPAPVTVEIRVNGTPVLPRSSALIQDVSPTILLRDAADPLRPAAALNEDGSVNSQLRPARQGQVITLYVTGFGQTQEQPNKVSGPNESHPVVYFRTWAGETLASTPAAGQPGVWLLRVTIPQAGVQPGVTPITVLKDGLHSNTGSVWVQ